VTLDAGDPSIVRLGGAVRRSLPVALGALAVVGVLAALQIATAPASASGRDALLELRLEVPHGPFQPGSPIEVNATLTNLGPDARVDLSSDTAIVDYSLRQLDGDQQLDGGVSRLICDTHDALIDRTPHHLNFGISGGILEQSAEIWALNPPGSAELRLPAGRWQLTAHVNATTSTDCSGTPHRLSAAVGLEVR
jgi:hypothetical protein